MSYDKMDNLIHKIFKFMTSYDKKEIKKIMNSKMLEKDKLLNISRMVTNYVTRNKLKPDEFRQDFIIDKLNTYLNSKYPYLVQNNCKIVDIGGGNGNVISGLKDKLNVMTNKEDFICVETLTDWTETYEFNNTTISYKFWKNDETEFNLDIPNNSVDIILCMVSLHHMSDDTISKLLTNIRCVLKPEGKVLIKEHDKKYSSELFIIWEHHLYHILDCAYKGITIDYENYKKNAIYNFKSKEQWNNAFTTFGYKLLNTTNRFLDGKYETDERNASELYWAIYQKKEP